MTGLALRKNVANLPGLHQVLYFYGRRTNESLEVLLEKSIPTQKNYFKATSDFVKAPIPESWLGNGEKTVFGRRKTSDYNGAIRWGI